MRSLCCALDKLELLICLGYGQEPDVHIRDQVMPHPALHHAIKAVIPVLQLREQLSDFFLSSFLVDSRLKADTPRNCHLVSSILVEQAIEFR